jgi:hypothetical protein
VTGKPRKTKAKPKPKAKAKKKTGAPTRKAQLAKKKRAAADAAIAAMDETPSARAGGRPSEFKEDYNEKAFKLCLLGYTDKELAEYFDVAESTLHRWKHEHAGFRESIQNGKELADAEVAHGLYKRAVGMTLPDVHISAYRGNVIVTDLIKHLPPEPKAIDLWLRNRQPKRWNKSIDLGEGGGMLGIFINETLRPAAK